MKNNLIFDLGFLNGEDSSYYMSKGYVVVAIEANPLLCQNAEKKFEKELKSYQLKLYNMAICNEVLSDIDFYINEERPEVSSTEKWIAEQEGKFVVKNIKVKTTSLSTLITKFGVPYYLKVDVEGMDKEISKQLVNIESKPSYISFELNKSDYFDIFTNLKKSGYNWFQLINQIHNKPNCSGDFGEYLPSKKWLSFDEAFSRYMKYRELKIIDNVNLGVGWMDLHAKL